MSADRQFGQSGEGEKNARSIYRFPPWPVLARPAWGKDAPAICGFYNACGQRNNICGTFRQDRTFTDARERGSNETGQVGGEIKFVRAEISNTMGGLFSGFPRRLLMKQILMAKRILTASVGLMALAVAPAVAQRKATIENVPEIPFTSAPNLLKLPPGEHLGRIGGRGHQLEGPHFRLSPQRQHAPVRIRSDGQVREGNRQRLRKVSNSPTRCAWIKTTTSGPWTKAPTW